MTSSVNIVLERKTNVSAVWIWDPDRLRILWADQAGLAFWGERSSTALQDRDFDASGKIVADFEAIRLAVQSTSNKSISIRLVIAPQGRPITTDCTAYLIDLPDSRQGIRFEIRPLHQDAGSEADRLKEVLARAPFAVTLFSEDGSALMQNAKADQAFGPNRVGALIRRFGNKDVAQEALRAVFVNGAHSMITNLVSHIGARAYRITMRRMQDPVSNELSALMFFTEQPVTLLPETPTQAPIYRATSPSPSVSPASFKTDLTIPKQPQETAQFSRLVEHSTAAIAVLDKNLKPVFSNDSAQDLLGLPLKQSHLFGLLEVYTKESARISEALQPVLRGKTSVATIDLVRRTAKGPRWARVSFRKTLWEGAACWGVAAIDITAERKALLDSRAIKENQARALDVLGVGTVFLDADGKIVSATPIAADILRYPIETLTGSKLAALLTSETADQLQKRLTPNKLQDRLSGAFDGQILPFGSADSTKRIRIAAGKAAKWTGAVSCIAFYEPKSSPEEAAGLARADAIAKVSHAMRVPLTAVLGFAELMLDAPEGFADPKYQAYMQDIREGGMHMKRLVEDLCEFHRLDTQPNALRKNHIDLLEILRNVITKAQELAKTQQIKLQFSTDIETAPILGDIDSLERAFSDLVHIALANTPQGGWVRIVMTAPKNTPPRVEIINNGKGLTDSDAYLSKHLLQADKAKIAPGLPEGTMGLPMIRKLIEAHGAKFMIHGEAEVGSVAIIEFAEP